MSGPPGPDPARPQTPTPDAAPSPAEAPRPRRVRLPIYPVRAMYVFLGVVVLVFAAQLALDPLRGPNPVVAYGAKVNERIEEGEVWRLLTAVFVHANVLHFAFNAYALYWLGREVEAFYGPIRFSLIFLYAGLFGSVMSLLLTPAPAVGASGGIFGLIGAEAVLLYRNRAMLGERGRRSLQNIVVIAAINLVIGTQGGIDNWAHLGGLAGGLAMSWLIGPLWAVRAGMPGAGPVVEDQQPLKALRWAMVAALVVGLAGLGGVAIGMQP